MVYTVLSIVEENVGQEWWGNFTKGEESRVRLCGRNGTGSWEKAGTLFSLSVESGADRRLALPLEV
jgi:hypothetical protein